jgi:DNA-binding response OmpR family regulator
MAQIDIIESKVANTLIVEDDEFISMVLQRGFALKNINTYSAANGKIALDILNDHPGITDVILDLNMPVMDGYALLSCLNKEDRFKKLHVHITSCNSHSAFMEYTRIRNINISLVKNFFLKPVAFHEILRAIGFVAA